jgi:hypothetical protein
VTTQPTTGEALWPEALATVTSCRYEFGAGRALAFGLPAGKHFRIGYNYFADGEFHTGELLSAKPIPQNTLFPIRFNPDAPRDHIHAHAAAGSRRGPLLAFGVAGSILLSLAWLAILRGCH